MNKINSVYITILFCLAAMAISAQQKYALLVGINKYYDKPGVLHGSQLQGCVDDALCMKGMLIHRFGFSETNINTMLDKQATRVNVMAALTAMLDKSRAGDAVIFYFSGHGVWMDNEGQGVLDDAVKNGMNQAMVMSDLYADNLGCLFTDANVKRIFNKFIDKKVVATAVFDCCFSGKMVAMNNEFMQNPYDDEKEAEYNEKSMSFSDVFTPFAAYCAERKDSCNLNNLNETLHLLSDSGTRSFDLNASIHINDATFIPRPADRHNGMFSSLAATNDVEKGLEIRDETGLHHGAFTKALLQAIKSSPADLPVSELIKKVDAEMHRQLYGQTPTYLNDPGRMSKNLLGIGTANFSNSIAVPCIATIKNQLVLNGGLGDGLAKGNILSAATGGPKITIRITNVNLDTAWASVISGNIALVKKGDPFRVTDGYTVSSPLIKVYIPAENISPAGFVSFVHQNIIPLARLQNYWDYENWYYDKLSRNIFFNDPVFKPATVAQAYLSGKFKDNFLVFLPVPAYVSNPLISLLKANQNIKLVKTAAEADVELYLNYTIAKGVKDKPGYVFTWHNFKGSEVNQYSLKFSSHFVKTPGLALNTAGIKKLAADLLAMIVIVAREKSSQWMNDYPVR
jgi:hypothetical protein